MIFFVCVCVALSFCICWRFKALFLALPGLEDEFMRFFIFKSALADLVATWSDHQVAPDPPSVAEQTFRGGVSLPQDVSEFGLVLFCF